MFRRTISRVRHFTGALAQLPELQRRNEFLLHEVRRLNEQLRALKGGDDLDRLQTKESFDFQWHELPEGAAHKGDEDFKARAQDIVCRMTDLEPGWFAGKRVVDVGCGLGRFTLPMLEMGARVTACDQSDWARTRTAELCAGFEEQLDIREIDLLTWDERDDFDLAFSFGVVHHTGNTYAAIRNVARKVGEGGRLFLMVYGFPVEPVDFDELNTYERLRQELRNRTMSEKRETMLARFGPDLALGYFDAVSPRINDLLTFEEIAELLSDMGFERVRRTMPGRNLNVAADKRRGQ